MNSIKEEPNQPVKINLALQDVFNKYPQLYGQQDDSSKQTSSDLPQFDILDDQDNQDNLDIASIKPSAFDLNFAEFPIAHLTKRLPKGVSKTEIKYTDSITGPTGNKVERKWTIRSNAMQDVFDEHGKKIGEKLIGIGGPTSLRVFYEIMQIWKEQGIKENKIHIGTYFGLLKRLGWGIGGKDYCQLDDDLKSIFDLSITAENAYFDKEQNRYVDSIFRPFTGWKLYKKSEIKDYMTDYGYIQVNEEFFQSFKKKSLYYLPFDGIYFKSLTAHEQKLAFYLTKIFNPYRKRVQSTYSRNILDLCFQLPIYGDNNKQKYYLIQACKGLIRKQFILLEKYEIVPSA